MSRTTLIECQPRRPDGSAVTLRLVDRSPRSGAYLGAQWLPHVVELPGFETAVGFDGQRWGTAPSPQIGALAFALAPEIAGAAGWVWQDAAVTIRQADWPIGGGNPADAAFQTVWAGSAAGISVDSGVARVELIDRGQLLRVPAAPLRFGSSGIALLDSAAAARERAAGAVVPAAFGRVFTLPGLLVDRLNNVWLFAAQPAAAVAAFYDGGAPFTLGSARASLAALQATAPAAGRVDWCLDAGGMLLARPADRPVYPFTCDATFGSAALGDIVAAVAGGRLPLRAGLVAALNGLGLGDCGLLIDDEATVADALDRLLAGLGIAWKVRSGGVIDALRLGWGSPVASFAAHQRHWPARRQIILPTGRRQLGFARNNRVHGEGEFARILLAENLAYADGTPVEALKPAEPGADVTADQPVVGQLNPATGTAGPGFADGQTGLPFAKIVYSGAARDGDVVSFPASLPAVPQVSFLPGGNTGQTGQNIAIVADGLSTSGFTMRAKSQGVSSPTTITDTGASPGGAGNPALVINRSTGDTPFDGRFTYNYSVDVAELAPGEPGFVSVGIFARRDGIWVEVGRVSHGATGDYSASVAPGTVDFGAGAEFGISTMGGSAGSVVSAFNSVSYQLAGSLVETSLTPAGASAIPFLVLL